MSRDTYRSLSSILFLMPDSRLWSPNDYLVITPEFNYSTRSYSKFFSDFKNPFGKYMFVCLLRILILCKKIYCQTVK